MSWSSELNSPILVHFSSLFIKEGLVISPWYSLELCIKLSIVIVQSQSHVQLFVTAGLSVHHQLWVHPNSCPLSQWCHPTTSSSIVPFSSCLQSFPASGSFPVSQFFSSSGQSIGVSASASVFPMNIQDWFPLGWTVGSPRSPRDSQESSPTPQFKSINSSVLSFLYNPTLTSIRD